MVLNEVTGIIGKPIALLKAIAQKKYSDYYLKYSSDDFEIPFKQDFRDKFFRTVPPKQN